MKPDDPGFIPRTHMVGEERLHKSFAHIHAYTHACIHTHMHTHAQKYTCIPTYKYVHTHIYTYTLLWRF